MLPRAGFIKFVVLGSLTLLASLWAATQYTAYKFGYSSDLGEPLFGHLYRPFDCFVWVLYFGHLPNTQAIWLNGLGIITLPNAVVLIVFFLLGTHRKLAERPKAARRKTPAPASATASLAKPQGEPPPEVSTPATTTPPATGQGGTQHASGNGADATKPPRAGTPAPAPPLACGLRGRDRVAESAFLHGLLLISDVKAALVVDRRSGQLSSRAPMSTTGTVASVGEQIAAHLAKTRAAFGEADHFDGLVEFEDGKAVLIATPRSLLVVVAQGETGPAVLRRALLKRVAERGQML
ncbi:MAG TPA: hypothetical protein ENJ19_08570 [Gammaproteobacteria bacterium]|nr:hypothetical protein [Gammaproteobacteria bacterium]